MTLNKCMYAIAVHVSMALRHPLVTSWYTGDCSRTGLKQNAALFGEPCMCIACACSRQPLQLQVLSRQPNRVDTASLQLESSLQFDAGHAVPFDFSCWKSLENVAV